MFRALIIILFFSFTVNAGNDLYYATLVKNIKVNNSNIEDDVIGDDNVENGESLSEIPKCEEIGEVGDLDCMGRLYVDNESLKDVTSGRLVRSNSGSLFFTYGWETINTYHVTSTDKIFRSADKLYFSIEKWDMSNVVSAVEMFRGVTINQNLNDWDVSNIVNMKGMFSLATINSSLDRWDVSNVTNMDSMFRNATVNSPLDRWDVSSVTNMESMFAYSTFNQPINNWDVQGVTNMRRMFAHISDFNQPLYNWNVGGVTNMDSMFFSASSFKQDISMWDVCNVVFDDFLDNPSAFYSRPWFPEEYLPDFGNDDLCN